MRNITLTQDGGAIVNLPEQAAAKSQLEAAGKSTLAAPYVDMPGVLASAERARSEEFGRLARTLIGWLKAGLKRAYQSDVERYLAQATDLADLERRLQVLARGEKASFG
ncbi:MAG TPA: DUF3563 family protein [Burkholderiales bacterium]|nr:DUF3563 family protein [Burkholderiales bacterium]